MPADRVVEMQLARLMQPEDPSRGEGLRVRGDVEAVPGRERLAGFEIRNAKRALANEGVACGDGQDAARKFRRPHLIVEPGFGVADGGVEPIEHRWVSRVGEALWRPCDGEARDLVFGTNLGQCGVNLGAGLVRDPGTAAKPTPGR